MYGKTSPKIKPKRQPRSGPKESFSESSFLSDSFCFKVLGKPCLNNIQKTDGCNLAQKDFNTPKINKNKYKIPKQQFAVYHLMEELNVKQPATVDQSFSEENMKETSLGSIQQIKRNSVGSRNSVIEQERSNQRIDTELELSASQASYIPPSQNFRQSQTEETVSKNSKDSAAYRYSSEIKSNEFEVKSKVSPNDIRTQDQRSSPIISREFSNPRSSLKIYSAEEPERYSIPNIELPRLSGCRNSQNDGNYDNKLSKIREVPKRDVAPCFCETDSQTSYPSILKQNRLSVSSNIDKYPVKECSWRAPKQKFVDKMQQTSENLFGSNSHSIVPLIDSSVNTLKSESASVQITELSSTKVQTANSSTPEEVCFRPIQNFCKCKDPPSYCGPRHIKRYQRSASDRLISIETNVTVPSSKEPVFRKPPPKAVVTLPTEMTKRGQERVRHRYSYERGEAPVFTETSDEPIYFQEDDIYDSYGECQSDYGEVDRYQRCRRNKYFPTREECYHPSVEGCRCCQNRKTIASTAPRRSVPYRPPPPPIDYELSSSEDDIELSFDENDDSDDPFFDQFEHRATRYKGLPYQNNDQYIDLVQELEETLQSRNKTRVQKALNEFEYKSRLNEPLERPIIDYEEPSDSEEPIIKKISELAEKRKYNHKKFPCRGKACCNCILRNDMKDNRPPTKPVVKSAGSKKKTKWQLNNQTGEWLKVTSGSAKRDHECGCTCACGRQVK